MNRVIPNPYYVKVVKAQRQRGCHKCGASIEPNDYHLRTTNQRHTNVCYLCVQDICAALTELMPLVKD